MPVGSFVSLWRIICLFFASSLASPTSRNYHVVEQLPVIPEGWTEDRAPPPSTSMKFRIAIRHDKMAEFEQKAIDIATPGNRLYGQFMTREEINDFLRPSGDAVDAILSWMKSEDVPDDKIERHGFGSHGWFPFHRLRRCCIHGFGPFVTMLAKMLTSEPSNIPCPRTFMITFK